MAENKLPLFEGVSKFYVYLYRDPRPRKGMAPIYVGKGTAKNGRADIHWRSRRARNPILANVLASIRRAALEPIVEIVAWYDEPAAAFQCEKDLVARFGRRDLGTGSLCNLTQGGDGAILLSEQTRAKMSAAASARENNFLGKTHSPETKARLSANQKGKVLSAEHRAKISAGLLVNNGFRGKHHTPETRAKISESNRSRDLSHLTFAGRHHTVAARAKISAANTGRRKSPDCRAKISAAKKGKPLTAEHRAKMSATKQRKRLERLARNEASEQVRADT